MNTNSNLLNLTDSELRTAIAQAGEDGQQLQPTLHAEAIRRYVAQGAAAPSAWRTRLKLTWAATLMAAAQTAQPSSLEEATEQVEAILVELEAAGGIGPSADGATH